jgi:DNA-binding protein HU-beta
VNKAQLIDELADRLGDKKTATAAVDGLVDVIVRTVHKGDKVNITGFGVFEKRARAARTARNPRTGESVRVKKTNVPAFRAGTTFKDVISGTKKLPRVTAASRATAASTTRTATTTRTAGSRPATRSTTTAKPATTRRAAAPKAAAKAPAKKAAPKAAAAKKTTAAPKAAAKKATPAKKAPAKKKK